MATIMPKLHALAVTAVFVFVFAVIALGSAKF